jgi:hypothetical protein
MLVLHPKIVIAHPKSGFSKIPNPFSQINNKGKTPNTPFGRNFLDNQD